VLTRIVKLDGIPTNLPGASTTQDGVQVWFATATTIGNLAGRTLAQKLLNQQNRLSRTITNAPRILETNFNDTAAYYAVICTASAANTPITYRTITFINQV
jgi:hypothetical protein